MDEMYKIWRNTCFLLAKDMPEHAYALWIKPLSPVNMTATNMTLQAVSKFHMIFVESRYKNQIEKALSEVARCNLQINVLQDKDRP